MAEVERLLLEKKVVGCTLRNRVLTIRTDDGSVVEVTAVAFPNKYEMVPALSFKFRQDRRFGTKSLRKARRAIHDEWFAKDQKDFRKRRKASVDAVRAAIADGSLPDPNEGREARHGRRKKS